jgi:hypothetical protein
MMYAVGMASCGMIYLPSFTKIGSGIQKLMGGGGDTQRHRQQGDLISLPLFFENKESRLKRKKYIPLTGNRTRFLGRPAGSLIAVPTEKSQLISISTGYV